jgi:hypothetical protein
MDYFCADIRASLADMALPIPLIRSAESGTKAAARPTKAAKKAAAKATKAAAKATKAAAKATQAADKKAAKEAQAPLVCGTVALVASADWLTDAHALWFQRAKNRIGVPLGSLALAGEVKHWKPEKLPPGISAKAYIKAVTDALRADPRLKFEAIIGTQGHGLFLLDKPLQQPLIPLSAANAVSRSPPCQVVRPFKSDTIDVASLSAGDVTTYVDIHGLAHDHNAESTFLEQHISSSDDLANYFFADNSSSKSDALAAGIGMADFSHSRSFSEAALLGRFLDGPNSDVLTDRAAFLNTHEPFCFATVGVQGAGKSHTLACVIEACLIPFPDLDVVRLQAPMSAVVFHYDQSVNSVCEATGLIEPSLFVQRLLGASPVPRCLLRERMTVLVSPSYYLQRRSFYGDYCTVRPLLLRWHTLTADHIKRIMRIKDGDNQLYVASLLDLLRRYQRVGRIPKFGEFIREVHSVCQIKGQDGPLTQRMALLSSLVAESDVNEPLAASGGDLLNCCEPGTLVVVDLTDPLLSSEEANGIFQVLTEQYRAMPSRGRGKLLALDEAHKFMRGDAADGLSQAIVNVARLIRHDGMRLAVSTQSPVALAPELLELVTVAALHRFHSVDWFTYLAKKLPLTPRVWPAVMNLGPGQALVFASQHRLPLTCSIASMVDVEDSEVHSVQRLFRMSIRPRLTADRGASRTNNSARVAKNVGTTFTGPVAPK